MISENVSREAVASHYDELDHFYRDVWGEHVHHGLWLRGDETRDEAVLNLVELIAAEAQIVAETTVCDIGCGYGATARVLAARGADVTGVTISPAQFAFAQTKTSDAEFVCADWLENKLPNESFDAAIAIESSEHMPDIARFFAEAHRVLRPNGILVVTAWLSADAPTERQSRWLLEPVCREGRMPNMGTVGDYYSLGANAGFKIERFQDVTQSVARTWPAIVRRFLAKLATNPRYLSFILSRN
ncbi:MAG: class I SAM-dependent methyltransferase, partial [Verrucomicrobiota bacterium]|nr:class I SAM-dependent methyltransferase [Verrucomicrobiota bacterium]